MGWHARACLFCFNAGEDARTTFRKAIAISEGLGGALVCGR